MSLASAKAFNVGMRGNVSLDTQTAQIVAGSLWWRRS